MSDQNFQPEGSRSPTYPYLTLEAAVGLAKIFFDAYRTGKVPIGIALEKMNYKITSGSGSRVIAALTQFRLFDTEGSRDSRKIWLSDLGLAIVRDNPREPSSRLQALRQAALQPNLFKWAYDHYRLDIEPFPAQEVFRYDLETEMGFTEGTGTADTFIKKFRETYDYAQLGVPDNVQEESIRGREIQTSTIEANPDTGYAGEAPRVNQPVSSTQARPADPDQLSTNLTGGKKAYLILPEVMNKKDFQLLGKWLELLREAAMYTDEDDMADDTENKGKIGER